MVLSQHQQTGIKMANINIDTLYAYRTNSHDSASEAIDAAGVYEVGCDLDGNTYRILDVIGNCKCVEGALGDVGELTYFYHSKDNKGYSEAQLYEITHQRQYI